MRCDGNSGIPFPTKQGNGPSSQDEKGKPELFLSCGGTHGVPFEWRRVCRGTSWVASKVSRTHSRPKREGGISLDTQEWKWSSSRVEGIFSWFFSSCGRKLRVPFEYDGDLSEPLVWPQNSSVSMRVARGFSGYLSSRCCGRGPHVEFRPEPQDSSPVLKWILGFLWSFHSGLRPHLLWRHASQLFS